MRHAHIVRQTEPLPKNWRRAQGRKSVLRWWKEWGFVRDGLDSGYHPCCIVTYKIRHLLMDMWAWAFNSQWLFDPNRVVGSWKIPEQKAEMDEWLNSLEHRLESPGYIQCYLHKALVRITKTPYEWYVCDKCDWGQIRFSECKRCNK